LGNVNLQRDQYLALQDQQVHMERIQPKWDAVRTLTNSRQEGYDRELSSTSRNVRHEMSARFAPYGVPKISMD
jgi:hypothetical protein